MPQDWDRAFKKLIKEKAAEVLGLCGIDTGAGPVDALATELQTSVHADLVFRAGRNLVHVEVQSTTEVGFEDRLVLYWAALRREKRALILEHRLAVRQVVVLPRGGPYTGRYEMDGTVHTYTVLDLKRRPPPGLLESSLAPLALLAGDRDRLVGPVVDRIQRETDTRARAALVDVALVAVSGDRQARRRLLDEFRRRDMALVLDGTEEGRQIEQRGHVRGLAEGEAKGRAETARYLLGERFPGDPDIEAAAAELSALPVAEIAARIKQAGSTSELLG